MDRPTVLVSGASIAGCAVAFWFSRLGWDVVVVERADAFRTGGQNLDIRGVAREVVQRMGLEEAIREHTTTEVGTRFVDEDAEPVAEFPATDDPDGEGLTAELEILRGDLAQVIADALPAQVRWIFGTVIETVIEAVDEDGAEVTLESGERLRCRLVVVAEGVRSSTRDRLLGDEVQQDGLGMTMVYGTIPRTPTDDRWWRWLTIPGSRQATLRPDNHGTTRATLAFLAQEGRASSLEALPEIFAGVGWEVPRILEGFATSDDVYLDELTQVSLSRYSGGRVVVTGDAAWCVTPIAGGGASLALVGGYVLAAMVSQLDPSGVDPARALAAYEDWMRPLVEQTRELPPGVPGIALPESELGVALQRRVVALAGSRPARALASLGSGGAAQGPELPEFRQSSP